MPGQGRLGDKANAPVDAHGCPACPHPAVGPAIQGSPDVNVNRRPALRVDDPGLHAACCGANTWTATAGSMTVFINGRAAHRTGDATRHCGGPGQLIEGSLNVMVGEASSAGVARSAPPVGSTAAASGGGARAGGSGASAAGDGVSGAGTSSADVTADGGTSANTGTGAAGDGAAEKPAADARLDPDIEFDPAAIHIEAQIATLRAAAAAHVPFCEACERTRVAQQASSASPS